MKNINFRTLTWQPQSYNLPKSDLTFTILMLPFRCYAISSEAVHSALKKKCCAFDFFFSLKKDQPETCLFFLYFLWFKRIQKYIHSYLDNHNLNRHMIWQSDGGPKILRQCNQKMQYCNQAFCMDSWKRGTEIFTSQPLSVCRIIYLLTLCPVEINTWVFPLFLFPAINQWLL